MRYADTPALLYLNDRAKLLNLRQWVMARFFDRVAPDGVHVLAYAFPHGWRPGTEGAERWPPHLRTAWYGEMADGSNQRFVLDVETEEFDLLPVIEGATDERLGYVGEDRWELPAVVAFRDGYLIDGRHVLTAWTKVSGTGNPNVPETVPALTVDPLSDEELEELRRSID